MVTLHPEKSFFGIIGKSKLMVCCLFWMDIVDVTGTIVGVIVGAAVSTGTRAFSSGIGVLNSSIRMYRMKSLALFWMGTKSWNSCRLLSLEGRAKVTVCVGSGVAGAGLSFFISGSTGFANCFDRESEICHFFWGGAFDTV